MKSHLLASITLFLLPWYSEAQINDCADAEVICSNAELEFNPIGPGYDDFSDPDNDAGCITTSLEQNSAWYYFEIDPNAPPNLELGFIIHPLGGYGEDYDWALFGPDVGCGALGSPPRCSSSSFMCGFCPETGMGMGATDVSEGPGSGDGFVMTIIVQPGQGYYLLIDNWLGTENGFTMEWTGPAAEYLNCDAEPPCSVNADAGGDITACEGEIFTLDGGNIAETYSWSGTNGGTALLNDPDVEDPLVTIPDGFIGEVLFTISVTEDTCTDEAQMLLTILPAPDVSINPLGPFCQNDLPQFLTATPPGGDWSGAVTSSTFNPATLGPGIHTIIYTFSNPVCTVIEEMEIEVYESPSVTIDPSPAEFCDNEGSILLTATGADGAGGFTYSWTTPAGMADGNTYSAEYAGPHTVLVTDENGCTNTATTNVISHPNPDISIVDPGAICNSEPIYTVQAFPPGGVFDGNIIDPSGEIYPNMVAPGTYTISYTFVDQHNCESTESININIISSPAAIATNNSPICDGQPILLSGQTDALGGNITYQWSGPNGYTSNLQNPTDATLAGSYIFQVFVGTCPSAPDTTVVALTMAPDATAVNDGPYCIGDSIHLFGNTNASGNLTFNWTGPNGYTSNVQNPTDATIPGVYALIISNGSCQSLESQTNVMIGMPPAVTISNTGPYCVGESIQLNGNTSTPGSLIVYNWTGPNGYQSNVQNPGNATMPGTYQLIVEVDGCPSSALTTDVVINALPQPVISGNASFCTGNSSTLDAGPGFMFYVWDNGNTNQTRTVSTSGTFSVTVTDVNGCTAAASFSVMEAASLSPVITGALAFCEGASTTLDAGAGYASYLWSTGEVAQMIDVSAGTNYGVIVTDADGCTGSANVTTIANDNPVVMIGGSTTYCIGGFTTLDAGAGYTSYTWSNASMMQTIVASSPGLYAVDVIDVNGCAGSGSVMVDESTSLSPVITGGNAFCQNGSTTLNAGSFATYIWSDGSMNQTLTVTTAGTYSVSVSDGQGCFGDTAVMVAEVLPPSATMNPTTSLCNTTAGGSILNLYDLILAGDNTGTWQDADNSGAMGLFTSLNFADIAAGDYTFTYTTNAAVAPCPETSYDVIVTVIDCACPDVFFFNVDPLCNGGDVLDLSTIENTDENGMWAIIQTPFGSNPAMINGVNFNATNGDPGAYTLQFTLLDQPPPGCPSDFQVMIDVDAAVEAGNANPPVAYCAYDNQTVDLNTLITGADAGGVWQETSPSPSQGGAFNAGNGTFNVNGQDEGDYTFEYSLAANGVCPADASTVTVIVNPEPIIQLVADLAISCDEPAISLGAQVLAVGPDYSITWTGPGIVIDGNEHTLDPTVDAGGNYTLVITDNATGCTSSGIMLVDDFTDGPTDAILSTQDPGCFGEQNAFIHITDVLGGEPLFMYSLNNASFTDSPNFNALPAGEYLLVVEDANGCRWDTILTLVEPDAINIDLGPDIELGLGETGIVQANINVVGTQLDTLIWSPASVIECIDVYCLEAIVTASNSVVLSATLIDLNGCEATDDIFILVNKERKLYIPTAFSPNGDGINDIFYILGDDDQIVEVKKFLIFNRWGGLVHEAVHFMPNDPAKGWDGDVKNEPVNPGVFTYVAEIEYIDGLVELVTGDVTVVK